MKSSYGQGTSDIKKSTPIFYSVNVDGNKSKELTQRLEMKGTFKYYENSDLYKNQSDPYRGKSNIVNLMQEPKQSQTSAKDDWINIYGHQNINFLDDSSFDNFIKTKKKVLIMFYAHCKYFYFYIMCVI